MKLSVKYFWSGTCNGKAFYIPEERKKLCSFVWHYVYGGFGKPGYHSYPIAESKIMSEGFIATLILSFVTSVITSIVYVFIENKIKKHKRRKLTEKIFASIRNEEVK